jgi:hypothetical protein
MDGRITKSMRRGRKRPVPLFDPDYGLSVGQTGKGLPKTNTYDCNGSVVDESDPDAVKRLNAIMAIGSVDPEKVVELLENWRQIDYIARTYEVNAVVAAEVYHRLGSSVKLEELEKRDISLIVENVMHEREAWFAIERSAPTDETCRVVSFSDLSREEQREYAKHLGQYFEPTDKDLEWNVDASFGAIARAKSDKLMLRLPPP